MNTKKILLLSFVSLQIFSSLQGMDNDNEQETPKPMELRQRNKKTQSPGAQEVDQQVFGGIAEAQNNPFYRDPCIMGTCVVIGSMVVTSFCNRQTFVEIANFFSGNNTQS